MASNTRTKKTIYSLPKNCIVVLLGYPENGIYSPLNGPFHFFLVNGYIHLLYLNKNS